jgi:hypothetical protein
LSQSGDSNLKPRCVHLPGLFGHFPLEIQPPVVEGKRRIVKRSLAVKVFLERSRERELSLCDAVSYAIVSKRLDWAPCLSFDADFASLGLTILR